MPRPEHSRKYYCGGRDNINEFLLAFNFPFPRTPAPRTYSKVPYAVVEWGGVFFYVD